MLVYLSNKYEGDKLYFQLIKYHFFICILLIVFAKSILSYLFLFRKQNNFSLEYFAKLK